MVDNRPFNYAEIHNSAVLRAKGDVVAFLNNDMEIIEARWLTEMVSHALRPEVEIVGAKLLYPDLTMQHAGIVVGLGAAAGHVFRGAPADSFEHFGRANLTHQVSAVTGACVIMRKETFLAAGGMNPRLRVTYNDVDLCLRVRSLGLLVVYTPLATLIHKEAQTRGLDVGTPRAVEFQEETQIFRSIWKHRLDRDPYYNPNLSLRNAYSGAFPPRQHLPWKRYE